MRHNHRFASLKGTDRKWLTEDDLELDAEPAHDAATPVHQRMDAEAEHDGWKPIAPTQRSLARLGDVLRL